MKAVAALEGKITLLEVEVPDLPAGHVLVKTEYSAISPGTEMTTVGRSSGQPVFLGYSAVGVIERIGDNAGGLRIGQRVACYGAPYVRHAEWLAVPANLTAVVPDHVAPEEAALAGLGAIAIHALRTADIRFGESAVIVGLGILGQMTALIAEAAAFRTASLDVNAKRVEMLSRQGVERVFGDRERLEEGLSFMTSGHGADCVLLCAGGPGEELINAALQWIRDKGKIVIVGDLTTGFSRGQMFKKEAEVLISRAGGPGRYDPVYEAENIDYPIGFVRWTEGRNIAEYIRLLADKRIAMKPLITDILPLERAEEAYMKYAAPSDSMGTLLKYGS